MSRKQEIFDKVVTHLRKQGEPASDGSGGCFYRTFSGLRCAAGCLIPDDDYDPNFESGRVGPDAQTEAAAYFNARYEREEVALISRLQDIHDLYEVDQWEEQFASAAKSHGLQLLPVTQ